MTTDERAELELEQPAGDAGELAAGVENTPELAAARALEWLDTTLQELEGALTRCGECIDAGTLDPAAVSGRMNTLVMRMMAGGAPASR